MGMLIDNNQRRWVYNEKLGRGEYAKTKNGLTLTNSGYNFLKIKKRRGDSYYNKCSCCGAILKSRYFGGTYDRMCLNCLNEWADKSLKELDKMKEAINNMVKDYDENKSKYDKEDMLRAIQNGSV